MKKIFSILFCVTTTIIGYSQKTFPVKSLYGHWVNNDFLNTASINKKYGNILNNNSNYCTEMVFSKIFGDSVQINNGFEVYKLSFEIIGNRTINIKEAVQGNDLVMYLKNGELILMDDFYAKDNNKRSTYKGTRFAKVQAKKNEKFVFSRKLNENTVAGKYVLLNNNKPAADTISFNADGTISSGLSNFKKYELCYAGDCVGMCKDEFINIISLYKNNREEFYGWQMNKDGSLLTIYTLSKPKKNIKGELYLINRLFELKKI